MKLSNLNKRPQHTLLFITETVTFRVDADRKGILLNEIETIELGCKTTAQLAKTFTKIAGGTGPYGHKVWILFMRLPALLINVPTMQVQGVEPALLTQALQFEAEGMTGMSALDAKIAFSFLQAENEMSDYWFAQIEQLAFDDLRQAAKKHKCQLAGVLNPGALPAALSDPDAEDWLRLEAWSNQLIALRHTDEHFGLQVFSYDNPHWHAELEQWLQEQDKAQVSETLLNNRIEMLPPTDLLLTLHNIGDMTTWFAAWARCLVGQRGAGAAVLQPVNQINIDYVWMVGSGIAAVLLCGLHAGWFFYQQRHFDAETEHLTKIEKDMADLRKQITESSAEQQKYEKRVNKASADANSVPATINKLQQRPALLLQALAKNRDQGLIVESITSQGDTVTIGGVSLQAHLGNHLAGALDSSLRELNWSVDLPAKKNMALFDGEPGPWSFDLTLIDTGMPGYAPLTGDKGNKPKA